MRSYGAQNMFSELKSVLINNPLKDMSYVDCEKWHYQQPLDQKKIEKNFFSFTNLLKSFGSKIYYLDQQEKYYDSIFPHDPSLVTNYGAIILNMGKKLRKHEPLLHKKFYESINIPILGEINTPGTVEGGDCLWIDEKTLVVGKGFRTNRSGVAQLKDMLNQFGIKVIGFDLPYFDGPDACLHLMSLISILDNNLAIVYKPFFPVELLKFLESKGFECIDIPKKDFLDSNGLAINILALSPRNVIMLEGFSKTEAILKKKGCNVKTFDGKELCIKAEGGPTCLTRPIYRK